MAEPIPRWLMEKYTLLLKKFKENEFTFDEAMKTLNGDKVYISIVLSRLRKAGWLERKMNTEDARKRIYNLIAPEIVMKEIAKELQ